MDQVLKYINFFIFLMISALFLPLTFFVGILYPFWEKLKYLNFLVFVIVSAFFLPLTFFVAIIFPFWEKWSEKALNLS
ncbi:MAG: hypothetical protein Q7S15_00505 [bacterium]|nr:hypothetical protein [bacterium]